MKPREPEMITIDDEAVWNVLFRMYYDKPLPDGRRITEVVGLLESQLEFIKRIGRLTTGELLKQ